MKSRPLLYIFMIFLLPAFSQQAEGKVYKCRDSSGKVLYKNTTCPEDQKSETVINTDRSGTEYKKGYYYENENYVHVDRIEDVKKISSGERVNLKRYIAENKITTFLFYADWCHSCEKVRPRVEKIALGSDNIILRKIDITKFESPVTEQYGIKSIPYFIIYNESGDLAVKGSANNALNYLDNNI